MAGYFKINNMKLLGFFPYYKKTYQGGLIHGNRHEEGGVPAIVDDKYPIEVEGGEAIINREAVKKHAEELSRINQSAGNGVPIMAEGGIVPKKYELTYSKYGSKKRLTKKFNTQKEMQEFMDRLGDSIPDPDEEKKAQKHKK